MALFLFAQAGFDHAHQQRQVGKLGGFGGRGPAAERVGQQDLRRLKLSALLSRMPIAVYCTARSARTAMTPHPRALCAGQRSLRSGRRRRLRVCDRRR
jgi:hypothetical protein